MIKAGQYLYLGSFLGGLIFFTACFGSEKRTPIMQTGAPQPPADTPAGPQIAEYVRNILEDQYGNLWFGTNGYGIGVYDGKKVSYYSTAQGFNGQQITGIAEDPDKNIWFATNLGVVKYALSGDASGEKKFINYSYPYTFSSKQFWSICADRKGFIWAGAADGIYRFDGTKWSPFALPYPEVVTGEFITKATSWSISEDKAGNIWFSTNGFGAFKYDGDTFTRYSEKEGLTNNNVDQIMEDSKGNVWFGTRDGGISKYDGRSFINYTAQDSIRNNEVCVIYEDKQGNIWLSSEGFGVYRYDGKRFRNYGENEGLGVKAVQTILEDSKGRFWVGGGGGLFRLEGETFVPVTKQGPWN